MPFHRRIRLPISTRHAFALAFDLAVRRDAWSSLVVPLLLRAPWILALAVLPKPSESDRPGLALLLYATAAVGDFVMLIVIGAMLRYRARSVFNTPVEVRPAPATDCYAQGLRRAPWLIVTEIVRNLSIVFATFFFVLPGIFLGFRLSFATESVVLHEPTTAAAFRHSFRLTPGRFERWFEMIVVSVVLVLGMMLVPAIGLWLLRDNGLGMWSALPYLLGTAIAPVIQYAWTFFYLRLVEIDAPATDPAPGDPGPLYAMLPAAQQSPGVPAAPAGSEVTPEPPQPFATSSAEPSPRLTAVAAPAQEAASASAPHA